MNKERSEKRQIQKKNKKYEEREIRKVMLEAKRIFKSQDEVVGFLEKIFL